jgi:acetyltransferase-like isoleucine patch superfamily enzyme
MSSPEPAMTPQQREFSDTKHSGFSTYKRLVTGDASLGHFLAYELGAIGLSNLSGVVGYALRSMLYSRLFRKCGRRPAIGKGATIRVPSQIEFGDGVLVDDYVALDVRGTDAAISLGSRVSIGRFSTVAAKGGRIVLGQGCNIGSYCRVATNSLVELGDSVLVGAYSYLGPGNHTESRGALIESPMEIRGGVKIGSHAWIGAHVTVLDGVSIGKHAIVGAHSLVLSDIPDWGVAFGIPAKVVRVRNSD